MPLGFLSVLLAPTQSLQNCRRKTEAKMLLCFGYSSIVLSNISFIQAESPMWDIKGV